MKKIISVYSTILLVDDELEILEYTRDAIAPYFEKILIATGGNAAIEILKNQKVDLIVTDYLMPQMTGLQLINFIKANYPLIPIIMLTGNGNNPEVLLALTEGAFDIIEKPFRTPVLINRIENGLLVPELVKTAWNYISNDLSLPRMEEFLRKTIKEQYRIMYAYSSVGKMKSLLRNEIDVKNAPRAKIRFKPEKNEICFISFDPYEFKEEVNALILNESAQGACLIINKRIIPPNAVLSPGVPLFLKIGNLDPIESVLRWVTDIDNDLVKIGIQHPL